MAQLKVGQKVRLVNFHGEEFKIGNNMGYGYIRFLFHSSGTMGEDRATIYFPQRAMTGSWPVEMVKAI